LDIALRGCVPYTDTQITQKGLPFIYDALLIRVEEPEEAGIEESELALFRHSGRVIIEEKWRK
jgi:hypothetical protein